MALIDRVKARYSATRLAELTNPDSTLATTDDTFLEAVCDDVEATIDAESVGSYDDDDPRMVVLAVDGVVALMSLRIADIETNRARWDRWIEKAKATAMTIRRDRVTPVASEVYHYRKFGRRPWRTFIPGRPKGR